MRALVWFRSDLRVRDNPALWHAARSADRGVIGVFLVASAQWHEHDWGQNRTGFVLGNVRALAAALRRLNIPLVVAESPRFADAPAALLSLARSCAADALCFNLEHEINERRRDDAVIAAMQREGVRVRTFRDQTLLDPVMIRTTEGRPYTVFTPFKRACLAGLARADWQPLGLPRRQEAMPLPPTEVLDAERGGESPAAWNRLWPSGETAALKRLARFTATRLARYADDRNRPAAAGTSRLSPYLAAGVISPRQCLAAAVEAGGGRLSSLKRGAESWVNELLWREFYRHVVVNFPRVCMGRSFQSAGDRVRWRNDAEGLAAWREGRTGFPIVDAGMRQLLAEGWMHNRLRMITAMFLAKDLLIDWREGERHFARHLVDADLANNNGGWQWAASTGTDAAPYFRVFNPARQSRACDPGGEFIRRYVPELAGLAAEHVHEPWLLPARARARLGYPERIVDHGEAVARVRGAFRRTAGGTRQDEAGPRPATRARSRARPA
jgi:deoxyribodipyrimidine photo-lyase